MSCLYELGSPPHLGRELSPPSHDARSIFLPSLCTGAAGPREDGPRHRLRGKGRAGMCCGEPYGGMQHVGEQDPPTRTLFCVPLSRE